MTDRIKQYLTDRGLKPEDFAYGEFYGFNWIAIPVRDEQGEAMYFKLRRDPDDYKNLAKYKFYPAGSEAGLFGLDKLKDYKKYVIICEGEFDALLLQSRGLNAISSTAGATSFKDEWVDKLSHINKVYVLFDSDEAGKKGANNLIFKLIRKDHEVFNIELPKTMTGKDASDYFLKNEGTINGLFDFVTPINVRNLVLPEVFLSDDEQKMRGQIFELATLQDQYRLIRFTFPAFVYDYIVGDLERKMKTCQFHIKKMDSDYVATDIESIKAIPIINVLDSYGIKYTNSSSNRISFKLRNNENTASAFAYIDTNSFCDYGDEKSGSVIDLVMALEDCGIKEAIDKLKQLL